LLAYVNGVLVPEDEATISVFNAGFNFADGVFEGIRVYGGRVFRLDQHLDRLAASAAAFELDLGMSVGALRGEVLRWLAANGVDSDFHFRPIVTRADRHPPRMDPRFSSGDPTVVIVGGAVSQPPAGVAAVLSSVRRPAPSVLPAHVKSLSYGPALLARLDAIRRGADEAIMLDELGLVAEASVANLFAVARGVLLTPVPRACLDGITRRAIIDLSRERGYRALEVELTPEALASADEIFLTGTSAEVTPVLTLDGRPVADGEAGPITRELAAAYRDLVYSEGTAIVVPADSTETRP
jgi:branched-chain amino acid aminotransferase